MTHAISNENKDRQNQSGTVQKGSSIETCTMDPCPMKEKNEEDRLEKCPSCGMPEKQENQTKGDRLF